MHPSTPSASAPPGKARANFRTFLVGGGDLEVGVVYLVVLGRLSKATTKKVVDVFEEKSAPSQRKCSLREYDE